MKNHGFSGEVVLKVLKLGGCLIWLLHTASVAFTLWPQS